MDKLLEEALLAENARPAVADFVRSLYQQESSGGKNEGETNAGAAGPMMLIQSTFNAMADPGWKRSNREQNMRAGIRYATEAMNAANDDPRLAGPYYYGGPGGFSDAKRGVPRFDKRNPGAPNTLEYGNEVAARMGVSALTKSAKDDPIGAFALLEEMKGNEPTTPRARIASPYPRASEKLSMDDLLKKTENIGGTPVAPAQPSPIGAAPVSTIPATTEQPPEGTTTRTNTQKWGRVGAEVAGGLVGGIAGAPLGPAGVVAGGAAGSALGSQIAHHTFDPSENPGEDAAWAAGGSVVGSGIGAVFSKLIPKGLVREGGEELMKILQKVGYKPTPAQYWNSNTLKNIEGLGSQAMKDRQQLSITAVQNAAKRLADNTAATGKVGSSIMDDVAVKAQAAGVRIETGPLNSAARALKGHAPADSDMANITNQVLKAPNGKLPFNVDQKQSIVNQQIADKINAANGGQQIATPHLLGAQQIRTKLLELGRTARAAGRGQEAEAANNLAQVLTHSMEAQLGKHADLSPLWRAGRSLVAEGKQGKAMQDILSKASVSGGTSAETSGTKLMNAMKDHVTQNVETRLAPIQKANMTKFARALDAAEEAGKGSSFRFSSGMEFRAVQLAAGGMAAKDTVEGETYTPAQIGAAIVLLSPSAISMAFSNPATFNIIMKLTRLPEGAKAVGTLSNQLIAQMLNERYITPDNIVKPSDENAQATQR